MAILKALPLPVTLLLATPLHLLLIDTLTLIGALTLEALVVGAVVVERVSALVAAIAAIFVVIAVAVVDDVAEQSATNTTDKGTGNGVISAQHSAGDSTDQSTSIGAGHASTAGDEKEAQQAEDCEMALHVCGPSVG